MVPRPRSRRIPRIGLRRKAPYRNDNNTVIAPIYCGMKPRIIAIQAESVMASKGRSKGEGVLVLGAKVTPRHTALGV
jgi:hypothetical protein